jgi:CheY-like chemotaxis protein
LPVVLASGFLSDEALQGAREQGVVQTIDKPYTLDALGRAISAALRSTPAPTGRS